MKVNELLHTNRPGVLFEGQVDPNILMNIDRIIKDGKVTNNMQNIYVAKMIEMLKFNNFQRIFNWNEITTPAEIMNFVKSMPPAQMVPLAEKLKELLYVKDQDLLNKLYDPSLELSLWTKYVCKRDD